MDAVAFSPAPSPNAAPFPSASPSSRGHRFSVRGPRRRRPLPAIRSSASPSASHHDVVVVGAGIVGLSIARHLLLHTPLSVAVADAAVPCSGATGAGQGYVWMSHRTPGNDTWDLAVRSKQLWEELAAEMDGHGAGGARESLGWMKTGSSREFKGFSREVDKSILKSIWDRAGEFFPAINNVHLDIDEDKEIRIGHRPYMPDGKPVIGFVPDMSNVLIATGHEGSGLALALGTAEMVTDMILGDPGRVDFTPFSIENRFSGTLSSEQLGYELFFKSWCPPNPVIQFEF
ncbi:hypothetical protein ACQJBY_050568 [Aegilops geniculata]